MHNAHGHESRLMLAIKNGKPIRPKILCDAVWAESCGMPRISVCAGGDPQLCRGVATISGDDDSENSCCTFRVSEV